MQLRRAARLTLSLAVLLASAGCVSAGPRGVPPAGAVTAVPPGGAPEPGPSAAPPALPLDRLPEPDGGQQERHGRQGQSEPGHPEDPQPPRAGTRPAPPGAGARRPARPAAPRKAHPRPPAGAHRHLPVPGAGAGQPYGMEDVCGAAEGTVPPSVVDLCVGQYGR
ncbi:hypothetical protein [Streptomyces sp. NPDC048603]|uniref:hypothetical protein n=1 Tax=Streptomyces sp. NPDC048603 TaxID=3365577 RepID=UPI003724A81C